MADADRQIRKSFQAWYSTLIAMKNYETGPHRALVATTLVALEWLRARCDLGVDVEVGETGAQTLGLDLSSLRKALGCFGESKQFSGEGGRANKESVNAIRSLLQALSDASFGDISETKRLQLLDEFQEFLVESLDGKHSLHRICFDFDPSKPPRNMIADILTTAQQRNQGGPVAQHLVGAKLAIRFPHAAIRNSSYSVAGEQAGKVGEFNIGKAVFYVTVSPKIEYVKRCAQAVKDGLSAVIFVLDSKLSIARALLEYESLQNKIAAESLESSLGQTIWECAEFSREKLPKNLTRLLIEYNRRVTEVETDNSLLIEIPAALRSTQG